MTEDSIRTEPVAHEAGPPKGGLSNCITDDALFRDFMRDPELAAIGVRELMPDDIRDLLDYDAIKIESPDYLDVDMHDRKADCVFTIPVKRGAESDPNVREVAKVRIIFEHKSRIRPSEIAAIVVQGFRYFLLECEYQVKKRWKFLKLWEQLERIEQKDAETATGEQLEQEETEPEVESPEPPQLLHPFVVVVYAGPNREITELKVSDVFKFPKGMERYYLNFPTHFVNVTRMRDEGFVSENGFLEAMYRILTSNTRKEVEEVASTALEPLAAGGELSPSGIKCVNMLSSAYLGRCASCGLPIVPERVQQFLEPVASNQREVYMTIVQGFISPEEQVFWYNKGIADNRESWEEKGIEKGIEKGVEKGRAEVNSTLFESFRTAVAERFGGCPEQIAMQTLELDDAGDYSLLIGFTMYRANSIEEVAQKIEELASRKR